MLRTPCISLSLTTVNNLNISAFAKQGPVTELACVWVYSTEPYSWKTLDGFASL